jgi:hypothetical protein
VKVRPLWNTALHNWKTSGGRHLGGSIAGAIGNLLFVGEYYEGQEYSTSGSEEEVGVVGESEEEEFEIDNRKRKTVAWAGVEVYKSARKTTGVKCLRKKHLIESKKQWRKGNTPHQITSLSRSR